MQDMSRKSHKRELFRVAFKMFILKSFDGVSIPDIEKVTGFTRVCGRKQLHVLA